MMRYLYLMLVAFLSTNVFAVIKDYPFYVDSQGKLCLGTTFLPKAGVDAAGFPCSDGKFAVGVRFIDAPEDKSSPSGIYLERPFLIVDGINLDPVEKRTLTDLHNDVLQIGLPQILKNLGYTPVLVQFSETVRTSLQDNSNSLSQLFSFLNNNLHIPFPGAKDDGFIVMGISQGGVIGRYGSYLYDTHRSDTDAPIRLFSSLDSPHQGAVMPFGLLSTVSYWSLVGGSSAAEMFKDILVADGAADLLYYDHKCLFSFCRFTLNTEKRFLFDDYRKAAEYKGFPTVLIAQGQLKGASPEHKNEYYRLHRSVKKGLFTFGSVISRMAYSENGGTIAYNRLKEKTDDPKVYDEKRSSTYDFIQGSTYPFAATIYNSLRNGFLDAMPDGMTADALFWTLDLNASWEDDKLIQDRSSFIPTVSAMDMKCDGNLAMNSGCGFSQSSAGFPFENPGNRSSATVTFAVDPTHPRYDEAISGRHVEMPFENGSLNEAVQKGMQVDMWRILCEVAKYDYDYSLGQFRNPKLVGYFSPNTSCMDWSKMPDVIRNAGVVQEYPFAYARYDYDAVATEKNPAVKFKAPAGWKKVALWDHGVNIQANSSFEVDIKVENPKGNWMKAELLVCRLKNCSGYLQLNEVAVPVDGMSHTLRWQMPANDGALNGMRWFRLVLNSDGGDVTVSNPHMVLNTSGDAPIPPKIDSPDIYPSQYEFVPWDSDVHVASYIDDLGSGLEIRYDRTRRGAYVEFGKTVSMNDYNDLVVDYWPGTCQQTLVYFDSKKLLDKNLDNGSLQNGFVRKNLPLNEIIDLNVSPYGLKAAHRLTFQSVIPGERCVIKSIMLK